MASCKYLLYILSSSLQPPTPRQDTDNSNAWRVEIMQQDGTRPNNRVITDPAITSATFFDLSKGTGYRVRVRGSNDIGPGVFSEYVNAETDVDRELYGQSCITEKRGLS